MFSLKTHLYPHIQKTYERVLDILFPPICVSCTAPIQDQKKYICADCFNKITINTTYTCPACGKRSAGKNRCHQTAYQLAAACQYHEPIPQLIQYLKYKHLQEIHTLLAAILIVHIQRTTTDVRSYVISYIPLHSKKERERGFNQSHLLAQTIANYFEIPCIATLRRTRYTESQTKQKDRHQRYYNMINCFDSIAPEEISGKNILLIDDVSTSGATMHEAAKTLRKYHPRRITGAVIAKAE